MSRTTPFGRQRRQAIDARRGWPVVEFALALAAVGLLGYVAIERGHVDLALPGSGTGQLLRDTEIVQRHFAVCRGSGGTCVIDGDTIRIDGVSIRIADIDTPEVRNYGCPAEHALGQAATARMIALLNEGPFALAAYERDEDIYGRKLRILERDGQSLGMKLVDEGLARAWDGARRDWCG